MLPVYSND